MKTRATCALLLISLVAATAAQAADAKSGWFTTSDGVRLHYLDAGRGPAIVLVPGWTMPAEIWEPQIKALSKSYRVVALDPRSQGESEKPTEGHYSERRARDVKELIEDLKLSDVTLAGWSLGVAEVLAYARDFGTADLRALVLVDGMLPDPDKEDPQMARSMFDWLKQMQNDRRKFTEGFVRSMYKKPQTEEYIQKVVAASLKTPTNSAFTLIGNMMTWGDWRPAAAKIDKPVLYVITPQIRESGELLKKALPSARVEVFENAGHALFVDEAERFNALVEEFVKAAPSGTGQ